MTTPPTPQPGHEAQPGFRPAAAGERVALDVVVDAVTAAVEWCAARLPAAVAAAGVLMLALASRWPVQAVTGFRLEPLQAVGPALALTGVVLLTVSGAAAGRIGGASGPCGWPRLAGPARRAVRALGLGPVPRPRARALLVDPCLLALGCALLTALVMALLPPSTTASLTVLVGPDDRYAAAAAAGPLGTVGYSSLGAGFVEELLFRGPVVLAARLGAGRRLRLALEVFSGVLFALFHHSRGTVNVLLTGLWGLLLAGYAARRRSLWPLVLAHGLYDVWAFGTAGYVW